MYQVLRCKKSKENNLVLLRLCQNFCESPETFDIVKRKYQSYWFHNSCTLWENGVQNAKYICVVSLKNVFCLNKSVTIAVKWQLPKFFISNLDWLKKINPFLFQAKFQQLLLVDLCASITTSAILLRNLLTLLLRNIVAVLLRNWPTILPRYLITLLLVDLLTALPWNLNVPGPSSLSTTQYMPPSMSVLPSYFCRILLASRSPIQQATA